MPPFSDYETIPQPPLVKRCLLGVWSWADRSAVR